MTALLIQQIESDFPEVLQQTAGGGADEALAVPRPKLEKALLAHLQGIPLQPTGKKKSTLLLRRWYCLGLKAWGRRLFCTNAADNSGETAWKYHGYRRGLRQPRQRLSLAASLLL